MTHYPQLGPAIASSGYYYGKIVAELRNRGVTRYPDDLEAYGEDFHAQAIEIAAKALAATKDLTERVY